jgi:uncharacterized protein involved in response to NO
VLFPLGAALAIAAVLPFPLRTAGGGSLALFHSVAQILGFLTCFVVGFLFTFVPRRTGTPPPDAWEMTVAIAVPPVAVASAWIDTGQTPYFLWLGLVVVVIAFTVGRMRVRAAVGRVPAVLVWVPLSLAAGAVGAALAALAPFVAGGGAPAAWVIGRGLLVQGLVAGLVLGVGGLLVPQLTRGEEPAEDADPARRRHRLVAHAVAAAVFFGSFPLEVLATPRLGIALRALVAAAVLVAGAKVHRPPTLAGLHRWLVWLAAWLVPLGFLVAALFPRHRAAALHVVFVGGFSQLALAVGNHVAHAHGGRPERLTASPLSLRLMAVLLAAAFASRILAGVDLAHVARWLSWAALAFAGAVGAWGVAVAPALVGRPQPPPDRARG